MTPKVLKLLRFGGARAKEPSTWAGLGTLAAMTHRSIPSEILAGVVVLGGLAGGVVAVLLPEDTSAPTPPAAP